MQLYASKRRVLREEVTYSCISTAPKLAKIIEGIKGSRGNWGCRGGRGSRSSKGRRGHRGMKGTRSIIISKNVGLLGFVDSIGGCVPKSQTTCRF